jgi:type VI secretion system protein ImpC
MNAVQQLNETLGYSLHFDVVHLEDFSEYESLIQATPSERIAASVQVFLQTLCQSNMKVEKLDRGLIEKLISYLDEILSKQLDAILHHNEFQTMESSWRGLEFLLNRLPKYKGIKVDLLDCSKSCLAEDFEDSPSLTQSGLYHHVYTDEYDTPGGEPYAAIIADYEFSSLGSDMQLLGKVSHIAAAAHCPLIASAGAEFFLKESMEQVQRIDDLESYMEGAAFAPWRSFREQSDARYCGLCLPDFLIRHSYGNNGTLVDDFNYQETGGVLWCSAVYAFAANMARSFFYNGWCVQIRGPGSGGIVESLPVHTLTNGCPTKILIPETREFDFSKQGFIPLSAYRNQDYACFFSAASCQKVPQMENPQATANLRINAQLPYIFLASRLAHYLKVLQRENIGAVKDAHVLSQELNGWMSTLVTSMKNPGPDLVARYPLSEGEIIVEEDTSWPGFFKVSMKVVPHFQVEGVNVNLSLVSKMPKAKE